METEVHILPSDTVGDSKEKEADYECKKKKSRWGTYSSCAAYMYYDVHLIH
jgi:hypothetical protein